MGRKKRRKKGAGLGVQTDPDFFSPFGPKIPPQRELSFWEKFYGAGDAPVALPVPAEPQPAQQRLPQPISAKDFFDMSGMWYYVFQYKDLPRFRVYRPGGISIMLQIDLLTKAPEPNDQDYARTWQIRLAEFFGLPVQEIKSRNPDDSWNQYLGPFIEQIERQINLERPPGMKGGIYIRPDENGAFFTVYYE